MMPRIWLGAPLCAGTSPGVAAQDLFLRQENGPSDCFEKLPNEIILKIIGYLPDPRDVVNFGHSKKAHRILIAVDVRRWLEYGVGPHILPMDMPRTVLRELNRASAKLYPGPKWTELFGLELMQGGLGNAIAKTYKSIQFDLFIGFDPRRSRQLVRLSKPVNICSTSSADRFVAGATRMKKNLQEAKISYRKRLFLKTILFLDLAAKDGKKVGLLMPSLAALDMDLLYDNLMDEQIKQAQQCFANKDYSAAAECYDAAARYAAKAGKPMPPPADLNMKSLWSLAMQQDIDAAISVCDLRPLKAASLLDRASLFAARAMLPMPTPRQLGLSSLCRRLVRIHICLAKKRFNAQGYEQAKGHIEEASRWAAAGDEKMPSLADLDMENLHVCLMDQHIARAKKYYKLRLFKLAEKRYAKAWASAALAHEKKPCLGELNMGSLYVDCINVHIGQGQKYLRDRFFEDAEEEFAEADRYAQTADVFMLSRAALSLGFLPAACR